MERLELIEQRLDRMEQLLLIAAKNVLNVEETSLLLGVSPDRLRHLAAHRRIAVHKQGNRLYFSKADIEAYQLANRRASDAEIESRAATYATLNPASLRLTT